MDTTEQRVLIVEHYYQNGESLIATAVRESVAESLGMSIHHRAQELDITKTSLQRILTKHLHLYAYKV